MSTARLSDPREDAEALGHLAMIVTLTLTLCYPVLLRKYNAIVESGIPIHKRYDIPDHLIPPDSRVEIDAKIAAGYFTSGKQITQEDLAKTVGRTWEETEH